MLERLHIGNFRGFGDLEIDKLGRINLVAGKNNVGKTTLLEAISLLGRAGNARMALDEHLVRMAARDAAVTSIAETLWKPFFFGLDTDSVVTISGHHSSIGDMKLTISLQRPTTTKVQRKGDDGVQIKDRFGELALKLMYDDPESGQLEREARETVDNVTFVQEDAYVPFIGAIVQPGGGNLNNDARLLGQLRKEKRGDWLLEALRVVEPRLQGIEDNSSSGAPMIWVDIGLPELVPLPVLGAGMTYFTRIVMSTALVQGGVVLVDEIENGLHHSVLSDVWRVIGKTAEQFNAQIFATTHSRECVEAARDALGADGFRLHRLEVVDGRLRCVTYESGAIEGAIRHNLEFR